jgi:hypothetical protein
MTDEFYDSAEMNIIHTILSYLPIPTTITRTIFMDDVQHSITIERMGINPAIALSTYRQFGIKGLQYSAPTVYFWRVGGAPKEVCDAFKTTMGDTIFDLIQEEMARGA